MRLRRSNPAEQGFTRKRTAYVDASGVVLNDDKELKRIAGLAIPPAWKSVWICPFANGHIQAAGTDAAGRRQYIYHVSWRHQRDAEKHRRTLELGAALPRARRICSAALHHRDITYERVMAAAFRLLDIASLRVGSESYAAEHETFGLATLRRADVSVTGSRIEFRFMAKGGIEQAHSYRNASLARTIAQLLDREDASPELFAWRDGDGWRDVRSSDVNTFIKGVTRGDFTAKDFRTWNATVLMAQVLALAPPASSEAARRRTISGCYAIVADYLGNTPAIARTSYVDARVVDLYRDGVVLPARVLPTSHRRLPIHGRVERAVLRMLKEPRR